MTIESPFKFRKTVVPGRGAGSVIIVTEGGSEEQVPNRRKVKFIPPEYLNNLLPLAIEAFPDEFEGSEGASYEDDLLKVQKPKDKKENNTQVVNRTIATLANHGLDAESIAASLLRPNGRLYRALNLGNLDRETRLQKLEQLQGAVTAHWPSANHT